MKASVDKSFVETIGERAFYHCIKIAGLTLQLPDTETIEPADFRVKDGAFGELLGLQEINLSQLTYEWEADVTKLETSTGTLVDYWLNGNASNALIALPESTATTTRTVVLPDGVNFQHQFIGLKPGEEKDTHWAHHTDSGFYKLIGKDGNAFNILGICRRAMLSHRLPQSEIDKFTQEATSGNYDHLLCTCMDWFNVE